MFEEQLQQLESQHLLRRLKPIDSPTGPVVTVDGRQVILLASNDYLGLAHHPALIRAATQAIERFGAGSGASRLVCGTLLPHVELESALARFKETEAALLFGSGYLANLGIIPALIGTGGLILADRLCHASLIDGCRLSGADFRIFRHRDLEHLEALLRRRSRSRQTLIVTDGVFSMDGDAAPLPELAALASRYDAKVLIDDAHGTGVMGRYGRGSLEHFSVEGQFSFQMGTLGKALGSSGAYVTGSQSFIEYLVNTARSFMYTTAPPPSSAAAARAAIQIIEAEPERRARLWENRRRLLLGLHTLGFTTTDTVSPIIPVLIGDPETTLAFSHRLFEQGIYAPAIRPPTVPKSTSRIRTTVTSEHTEEQLDHALSAFNSAGKALGLL
ncbi:MAG: 8-amino-7-oxononanoate synthase [Nitrospiraceae bacterium]